MFKECPKCHGRMVTLADGYFCLACGRVFELSENPLAYGDSEATSPQVDPIPTPAVSATPDSTPQPLINHHATSYAQRRLHTSLAELEGTPELPSPVDPATEIEAPDAPLTFATPNHPDKIPEEASTPEVDTPEDEEDTTPVKPSAFLVHANKPLYEITPPALVLEKSDLSPEEQLLADARALSAASPVASPQNAAHEKAETLLAAAAGKQNSNHLRTWILSITSLILIIGGGTGAWLLLKTPSANNSHVSPSPSANTPTPSPSMEPAKRDSQRKSDLNSVAIGLEAYHKASGAYPVGSDISILSSLEKTTPPFITHVNLDPSSTEGTSIKYSYVSDGSSFALTAALENAQDPDAKDGLYIVRSKNQ